MFFASLCQIERTNERNQLERIQFSRLLLVRSFACKLFAFLPGQYIIVCMYVSSSLSSYELAKTKGLLSYSNEFSSPTNQSAPLFHSIQFFMLSFPFTATYLGKYCSCSHFRQVAAFIHSIIHSFEPTLPSQSYTIRSTRLDSARVAGSRHFVFIFAFLMLTFTICIYQLACFASCFVAPAKTIHSTRTRTESESSGTGYVTGLIAIYGLKRTNFSWHQPTRIQMR